MQHVIFASDCGQNPLQAPSSLSCKNPVWVVIRCVRENIANIELPMFQFEPPQLWRNTFKTISLRNFTHCFEQVIILLQLAVVCFKPILNSLKFDSCTTVCNHWYSSKQIPHNPAIFTHTHTFTDTLPFQVISA